MFIYWQADKHILLLIDSTSWAVSWATPQANGMGQRISSRRCTSLFKRPNTHKVHTISIRIHWWPTHRTLTYLAKYPSVLCWPCVRLRPLISWPNMRSLTNATQSESTPVLCTYPTYASPQSAHLEASQSTAASRHGGATTGQVIYDRREREGGREKNPRIPCIRCV